MIQDIVRVYNVKLLLKKSRVSKNNNQSNATREKPELRLCKRSRRIKALQTNFTSSKILWQSLLSAVLSVGGFHGRFSSALTVRHLRQSMALSTTPLAQWCTMVNGPQCISIGRRGIRWQIACDVQSTSVSSTASTTNLS